MRRSSFIKLTLLPMLASAQLVHADPDPPPASNAPGADDPQGEVEPAPQYPELPPDQGPYTGPPGMAPYVVMPPGETPPIEDPVPCDVDPDQPRCQEPVTYYGGGGGWWSGAHRGGFGGYFHGGGGHGGGGHGG